MHSARALFLTFLALEKSKRNNTLYEDYATAEREDRDKICSGKIVPQQCIPKSRDKICSGAEKFSRNLELFEEARCVFQIS
jgi:hypothetical protein